METQGGESNRKKVWLEKKQEGEVEGGGQRAGMLRRSQKRNGRTGDEVEKAGGGRRRKGRAKIGTIMGKGKSLQCAFPRASCLFPGSNPHQISAS